VTAVDSRSSGVLAFGHEEFRRGFAIALGAAARGGADIGEALVTAGRIEDGDADGWVDAWGGLAPAARLLGALRRAAFGSRRAAGDRVRGDDPSGVVLPGWYFRRARALPG
jgi:hypothetical protein